MLSLSDAVLKDCPELPASLLELHFRRMSADYLGRHEPEEIARHLRLISELHDDQLVNVDVLPQGGRAFDVCVVGHDRMGVLAAITTALVSDGFDVQGLQLATYEAPDEGSDEPTFFVDLVKVRAKNVGPSSSEIASMLRTRLGLAFRHLADGDLAAAQTAASDSQFLTRMTDWGRGRATAAAAAVKEGMVLDGFRLEQKLATGGMSEVYLATQLSLERKAAVKVVSGEAISANDLVGRFTEEARVVGGFTCPYIVPVLAFGTAPLANGTPLRWMAMEYMPSGDLADWLQRHGTPPMDLCVRWLSQALQGLSYAHRHGILHRDLKPHNLLLTADGDLKVTDFGLFKAKRLHDAFGLGRGAVVGTPHYTSPEQATAGEADERSDIFSLGATFFQLCTGRKLFEVEGTAAVLARISQEQAPSLLSVTPSAPRPMATLVDRMTRLAPEDRYQKMDVILADLNSYLDRGLLTAAPPGLLALDFTVDREQNPGASWSPSATTVTTIFRGQNDDEESSSF